MKLRFHYIRLKEEKIIQNIFRTDLPEDHKFLSSLVLYLHALSIGTSVKQQWNMKICIKFPFLQLTFACLFGSKRNKHPTWCVCVWIIPAHTILSGFGSIPSRSCIPNPDNLFFAPGRSSGSDALNTFWARCFSLLIWKSNKWKISKNFSEFLTLRDSSNERRKIHHSFL